MKKVSSTEAIRRGFSILGSVSRAPMSSRDIFQRLYDEGFKSIADIIERGEDRFKKCAKYVDDIEQRIPRLEMVKWRRTLKNCLPNGVEGECMGSYRREKEKSGRMLSIFNLMSK